MRSGVNGSKLKRQSGESGLLSIELFSRRFSCSGCWVCYCILVRVQANSDFKKVPNLTCVDVCAENFHHSLVRDVIAPAMPLVSLHADIPADEAAFLAPDANTWASLSHLAFAHRPSLTELIARLYDDGEPPVDDSYDSMALWCLLDGSYVHDRCRALASLAGPRGPDLVAISALYKLRKCYLEPAYKRHVRADDEVMVKAIDQVEITWHARILFHSVDTELLEGQSHVRLA